MSPTAIETPRSPVPTGCRPRTARAAPAGWRGLAGSLLACLILGSGHARADDAAPPPQRIGTIERLTGAAARERDGTVQALSKRAAVFKHERITTGPGAALLLSLIDATVISLGENGALTVEDYVYSPGARGVAIIDVEQGAFRMITGNMGKLFERRMEVRTPLATLSIRGTDFWAGPIAGRQSVVVLRGRVEVRNDAGFVVLDRKWQGTFLSSRVVPPSRPELWEASSKSALATTMPFN